MKKVFISFAVLLVISLSLLLAACEDKLVVPSEDELQASGTSIQKALPSFNSLNNNYSYKLKVHQTNGEDWFYYDYVKINDEDIFSRAKRLNTNVGWEYESEAFTDYEDLTEKDYTIYIKQTNGNYYQYRKYKYDETDEDFQKYYYIDEERFNLNENASYYFFDYSLFNAADFEYAEDNDINGTKIYYWKVKANLLLDNDYKKALSDAFYLGYDFASTRLDYVNIYVTNNKVATLKFGYSDNTNRLNLMLHNTITFDYENYEFNSVGLTTGFTLYEN